MAGNAVDETATIAAGAVDADDANGHDAGIVNV
jgi:hypothetical protein